MGWEGWDGAERSTKHKSAGTEDTNRASYSRLRVVRAPSLISEFSFQKGLDKTLTCRALDPLTVGPVRLSGVLFISDCSCDAPWPWEGGIRAGRGGAGAQGMIC